MKTRLLPVLLVLLAACASRPADQVRAERARELRTRGDSAFAARDWKGALALYDDAAEANPQAAETFWKRGNVRVELYHDPGEEGRTREHLERATWDYTRAVQLNPAYYEAYFNRAMLAMKFAKFREAVGDLLQCCQLRPKESEPHLLVAKVYEEKFEDRQVQALDHYEKYVELGGSDDEVREKVRKWRELKKSLAPVPTPAAAPRPTADDEKAAADLHAKALEQVKAGKKAEAAASLRELLEKHGKTKYVKEREKQLQVLLKAFAPQ